MNAATEPIIDAEYIVVNGNLSIIMDQNYHNFFRRYWQSVAFGEVN